MWVKPGVLGIGHDLYGLRKHFINLTLHWDDKWMQKGFKHFEIPTVALWGIKENQSSEGCLAAVKIKHWCYIHIKYQFKPNFTECTVRRARWRSCTSMLAPKMLQLYDIFVKAATFPSLLRRRRRKKKKTLSIVALYIVWNGISFSARQSGMWLRCSRYRNNSNDEKWPGKKKDTGFVLCRVML